ncbi:MAG: endonuclease [Planctomycetes bacterium]|nr:endonuclease [Planctomycetota bacterium]
MRRLLQIIGSLPALFAFPTLAQYDPPPAYYSTATGTGATLKAQLNEIIDNHTVISYSNRADPIRTLDEDPNNSLNLILVYSGLSALKSSFPAGGNDTEHCWPNSYGLDSTTPAYSDLFNLRPCNSSVNSSRGNKYYDDVGGTTPAHASAPECRTDSTRWEPRPIEKGDLARGAFYLDTRYEADANDGFPRNLTLTDNVATITASDNNFGKLATLVAWHYADPPSTPERKRNHKIYTDYQHNRNPYVDRPEFVWAVYGSGPNDSRLYIGGVEPADGYSSATVDFGSVIIGAAAPAAQVVTLNKSGTTPTTFDSAVSGDASSTTAGQGQAFVGGLQNRPLNVALASVAPVGAKSGVITIDNTDLTSAAAGQGSADGNDTITVVATVLDHSNASFDAMADQNTLTIDFGSLTPGGVVTLPFSIHNLESVVGYTAKLDIDGVAPSGDSATLYSDLAPIANIPAASSQSLTASFDTSSAGSFSATYIISVSDENLAGETTGSALTLTLVGSVIGCNAADANCDTVVDLVDVDAFVSALLGGPPCSPCAANLNNDAGVDGRDIAAFVDQLVP